MALIRSAAKIIRPTAGTWRVVLSRWGLYVVAMLPGLAAMTSHLKQTVGLRPWFQDVEMPLDMLSFKLVVAELPGGMPLLMLGALLVWVLQLVWLAGAVQIFNASRFDVPRKVFANGWPYLGRFIRIAVFAILAIIAIQIRSQPLASRDAVHGPHAGWNVRILGSGYYCRR